MSGVFEKDRSESELDYFELARKIWAEVVRLVRNEKDVPKSYRFLIGVPTAETARSMVANINRAYHFYPSSSFNVLERRRYLTLAIADCEQLLLDMQCMKDVGLPINVNRLENLIKMAEAEIGKLQSKRKNTRLIGKQTVEERIRDAESELERLRSV
nr:MAG: 23S rRNA-intervening sequence protein [Bacteriophage sp.]UWH96143.1 MAG: 23S rRNA-intervening sequence protein [Bacteriophage sp.]